MLDSSVKFLSEFIGLEEVSRISAQIEEEDYVIEEQVIHSNDRDNTIKTEKGDLPQIVELIPEVSYVVMPGCIMCASLAECDAMLRLMGYDPDIVELVFPD